MKRLAIAFILLASTFNLAWSATADEAAQWKQRALRDLAACDYSKACEDYCFALRIRPNDKESLAGRAAVRQRAGDMLGALADADRVLQIDPNSINAYNTRGWVYLQMRDNARATAEFTRGINCKSNDALERQRAFHNRGIAAMESGNYESCIRDLAQCAAQGEDDAVRGRALAFYWLGQKDKAIAQLNGKPTGKLLEAIMLAADGKTAEAKKVVEPLLVAKNLDSSVLMIAYSCAGDTKQFIEKISKMMIEHEAQYDWFATRAAAYNTLGEHQKALADCVSALELKPAGDVAVFCERGAAKVGQRRFAEAIPDLDRAIALAKEPFESADAYHWRSQAYEATGRFEQARQDEEKAKAGGTLTGLPFGQQLAICMLHEMKKQQIPDYLPDSYLNR